MHFGQSVLMHGHALSEVLNTFGDSLLAYESLYIIVMGVGAACRPVAMKTNRHAVGLCVKQFL